MDTAASSQNQLQRSRASGSPSRSTTPCPIAKQIEAGQASSAIHIGEPAFLGVAVAPDGTTSISGGSSSGGAVVAGVASGTPAEAAGLTQGDTITAIDNQPVDSAQTLSKLTGSHHPGDKVTVTWSDQSGASHSANVTLATGPAD